MEYIKVGLLQLYRKNSVRIQFSDQVINAKVSRLSTFFFRWLYSSLDPGP
jgi:hypothetical protein